MLEIIKKNWQILLVIAVGIILWCCWPKDDPAVPDVSEYVEKIDSLQFQIDSISTLRDSVDQRIDTVTITIEKTHIRYEKDRNTILNKFQGRQLNDNIVLERIENVLSYLLNTIEL